MPPLGANLLLSAFDKEQDCFFLIKHRLSDYFKGEISGLPDDQKSIG